MSEARAVAGVVRVPLVDAPYFCVLQTWVPSTGDVKDDLRRVALASLIVACGLPQTSLVFDVSALLEEA